MSATEEKPPTTDGPAHTDDNSAAGASAAREEAADTLPSDGDSGVREADANEPHGGRSADDTAVTRQLDVSNARATESSAQPAASGDDKQLDAPPATIVTFESVTKIYGEGDSAFTAIKDVSFLVPDIPDKGEFVAVLGPSGCGKSTVLRLIAGLTPQHPATSGQVLVLGKPVAGPAADRGMVFQDYTSFNHLTVRDNVAFGLACRGESKRSRYEQANSWIDRVGLSVKHDADKYPHELSGGMRQRVAIARTLALHPRIILMDEPFGALDPSTRMHMQDLLVSLWRELEATVFFVTHSIEEAVFLGDRIYILSSSPGTILREVNVPPPDWPAKEMQKHPEFLEFVFDIRDTIETLESSQRGGDD